MGRTNKAEKEARITKIVNMVLDGKTEFKDLKELATSEGWNLTDRQLWNYRRDADNEISEYYKSIRNVMFGKQMARYEALLKECKKKENLREWRGVLSAIDKIAGLDK